VRNRRRCEPILDLRKEKPYHPPDTSIPPEFESVPEDTSEEIWSQAAQRYITAVRNGNHNKMKHRLSTLLMAYEVAGILSSRITPTASTSQQPAPCSLRENCRGIEIAGILLFMKRCTETRKILLILAHTETT